jgi:hypothetical protein
LYAKLLTVQVLLPVNVDVAQVTDGLNEGFRHESFTELVMDWAYEGATPTGVEPRTVLVPDQYEEGVFLAYLPGADRPLTDGQITQLIQIRDEYKKEPEALDSYEATERDLGYFDRLMAVLNGDQ